MSDIPFLSSYDPPGTSEGTLDPLGLYQVADKLAVRLVPAIRERMQRVRFLTAMALGALITEELESDPSQPETPPILVWEWLVVEAIVRSRADEILPVGVPGTMVTGRALAEHDYLDSRSYLKSPRIFGFHGIYKRLAVHIGLVDVHFRPRPDCERLIDAWACDAGYGGLSGCRTLLGKWQQAVKRSLAQAPARTRPSWTKEAWKELADATNPDLAGSAEKRFIRKLLHADDNRGLGALPAIWGLQSEFKDDYAEEPLHERLRQQVPSASAVVEAIQAYEGFCRGLHDGFAVLRSVAATPNASGFEISSLGKDEDFARSVHGTDQRFEIARQRLAEVDSQLVHLFDERFAAFAAPMDASESARALCEHHEKIQKSKSGTGKRPWFDRLSPNRLYLRQQYRQPERALDPQRYVHDYRGRPIRDFYFDLR